MSGLRDELRGVRRPVPAFGLLLPSGWDALAPTEATFAELIREGSARLKRAGRPDLDVQFQTLMRSTASWFLAQDPVRIYLQRRVPEEAMLPLSLTASRVTGPQGRSLDGWVTELVRDRGAEKSTSGPPMIRWAVESTPRLEDQRVPILSINHLVPIPGTDRREALLFTAVIPLGSPRYDTEMVAALAFLCDTIISTFRWEPTA